MGCDSRGLDEAVIALDTNIVVYAHRVNLPWHEHAVTVMDAALSGPQEVALCWPVVRGRTAGGALHDGRIAAICLDHGVRELWTADRDFTSYPKLTVRSPLIS